MITNSTISKLDPDLTKILDNEAKRQQDYLTLIPSENYTQLEVREALGSVCTNKYSEGYAGRRYYNGNKYIDQIEELAIERTKKVFGAKFANVQPYSGSPANLAVYFSVLKPGDTVMGLELSHGGHLTHGAKVNFSGKWFNQIPILVNETDDKIDYDKVEESALKHKPKLIVAGVTAYPLELDYERLAQIAKKIDAFLLADLSHTNGLVVAGIHKNPLEVGADIITTTTHKLLRGPRGAIIATNNKDLAKKIDKAIMPGLQGGPHNHKTAAIATAMLAASTPEYKKYVQNVADNAQHFAKKLAEYGFDMVAGGTENHLIVLDLRNQGLNGKQAADLLEQALIVVNANTIPNDPNPPLKPSGIRIGTPAITTRGIGKKQIDTIAEVMAAILIDKKMSANYKEKIAEIAAEFKVPE